MILIISHDADEHARAVLAALQREEADCELLDLNAFPQHMSLALEYFNGGEEDFCLGLADREVQLRNCGAVWWRRPGGFMPHPELRRQNHVDFVYSESVEVFSGLWQALDANWMNHPTNDEVAARKVLQLKVARQVGLTIPRTHIGTDPERVQSFIASMEGRPIVYKAFSATPQEWRETRILGEAEMQLLDNVRYAPVIFQEYVKAGIDVRITIVGEKIFAGAIHSQQSAYEVDFRMDMPNSPVEALDLPTDIENGLRRLMDHLGLVYGAIDMRRRPDGEYVFLEINPAGQWLFMEQRSGHKITDAVAKQLIDMDRAKRIPTTQDR